MKNPIATCQCHDCQKKRFVRRERNITLFAKLPIFLFLIYILFTRIFS